ncbi:MULTISPECIES: nuclear transport factor 2 family protein [Actinomadura]|uniref:Nuclear transport factor 2 family protein n=1 Tax=Actinomadura bangladeshensis TaxID=453573 RepID=A0A4V2XM06_9ACTN|nr:nuclear transport factor 2 family protein [Actinomadura bangladeshensis]NEA21382.1 nuclear transport factor 2 family protein [Actinomadura bangladeshensis]TDC12446.1 nuclear transport factor 2 family protein [Actinomadura bangladeshensis]
MHPFRAAIEKGDIDALPALLAEDVVFLSPVAFAPYEGRAAVTAILRAVTRVFTGFRYVREIGDGRDHALVFKARVGDREVHGCDFLHHDDAGLIDEFCVMVRPLSGARALADAMAVEFANVRREMGLA